MLDVHEVRGSTPLSPTYSRITLESKHEIGNYENNNMTSVIQRVFRLHGIRSRLERPDMTLLGRSEVRLLYRPRIYVLLRWTSTESIRVT